MGELLEAEDDTNADAYADGDEPRFVVSEGTVLDTTTGRTWQRQVPDKLFTWRQAKNYAASLDLNGGGWRLPAKDELMGIVDKTQQDPCIDHEEFPDTPSDWFWSASPFASNSYYAWSVYFYNGYSSLYNVNYNYRVRCVR
jgi:hypothetical protein